MIEKQSTAIAGGAVRQNKRRIFQSWMAIPGAVLLLLGLFALGYWPRIERERQVLARVQPDNEAVPLVGVATVMLAPAQTALEFPATLEALTQAPIFSRADGYVRKRYADIGDHVSAGAVLAEVESPDLERQIQEAEAGYRRTLRSLRQAEAIQAEAEAGLNLAKTTAKRWDALVESGVLARQAGDEKAADLEAKRASLEAAKASVLAAQETSLAAQALLERNRALMEFRTIRAPFAGVITARNIDVGALITAGSGSSVRELFQIAQTDTLRVFLQIPQSYVRGITVGLWCQVNLAEYQGTTFRGKVTRTANSLDPASRTLLTEVQIANPDRKLLPGMYARVHCQVPRAQPLALIPSSAWRTNAAGPEVAVVMPDATIQFRKVRVGRDLGSQIEILEGLVQGERVAISFTDQLHEGVAVQVREATR